MAHALPDELLLLIFSRLEKRDALTVLRVCVRWRRLGLDRSLWRAVDVRLRAALLISSACTGAEEDNDATTPADVNGPGVHLKMEDERRVRGAERRGLLRVGSLSHGVTSCSLSNAVGGSTLAILQALEGSHALRSLSFHAGRMDGEGIFNSIELIANLEKLEVRMITAERTSKRALDMFVALIRLPQESLVVNFQCESNVILEGKLFRQEGGGLPPSTLAGFVGRNCLQGVKANEPGIFHRQHFPNLRILSVRRGYRSEWSEIDYFGSLHVTKGFGNDPTTCVPPLLEEFHVSINDALPLRLTYEAVKRLHLRDGRSDHRNPPFLAQQFPRLEYLNYSYSGGYSGANLLWWRTLMIARSQLPHLREIVMVKEGFDAHGDILVGAGFPICRLGREAKRRGFKMDKGRWKIIIEHTGYDRYKYRAVRTPK